MIVGFVGFCFIVAAVTMFLLRMGGNPLFYEIILAAAWGTFLTIIQPDFIQMIYNMIIISYIGGVL
jgi:hypothetical protein